MVEHLSPSEYIANGYHYRLDSQGRIVSAEGELHLAESDRVRNAAAQREAGHDSRDAADDGGHLIGTRFGGSPGLENLVAQNRVCNRRDYKSMENEWAHQLELGNQVRVRIEPVYRGDSERPTYLTGSYTITRPDGSHITEEFSFTNIDTRELEQELDALPEADLPELERDPYLTPEQQQIADEVEQEWEKMPAKKRHELLDDAAWSEQTDLATKKEDGAPAEETEPDSERAASKTGPAPVNGPDPAEAAEPRQVPEDGAPDRRAPETGTESADGRQGGLWNWIKSKFSGGGTNDIPGTEGSDGPRTAENAARQFEGLPVDEYGNVLSPDGHAPKLDNDEKLAQGTAEFVPVRLDPPVVEEVSANRLEMVRLNPEEIRDPDVFWSQHNMYDKAQGISRPTTKEDFLELASHIPEVKQRLAAGETLESLEKDPKVGACATQYFDPQVMPRAVVGNGFAEMQDGGRHRILAARELGFDIPVHVVGRYQTKDIEIRDNIDPPPPGGGGAGPIPPSNPPGGDGPTPPFNPPGGGGLPPWDLRNYDENGRYIGDRNQYDPDKMRDEIYRKALESYAEHVKHAYPDPLERSEAYADYADKLRRQFYPEEFEPQDQPADTAPEPPEREAEQAEEEPKDTPRPNTAAEPADEAEPEDEAEPQDETEPEDETEPHLHHPRSR